MENQYMIAQRSVLTVAGLAAVAALSIAGCSTSTKEATTSMTDKASSAVDSATSAATSAMTSAMAAASGDPVGAGCAAYAEANPSGPGSVAGLAMDPVATAAGNSPVLTTLTSALSGKLNPNVNLVETLNNGQFTVFAPTDDAFAKLDAATIETLKTDSDLLSSILTYHVVSGTVMSTDIMAGDVPSVEGSAITLTTDYGVQVNDALVISADIEASNGVIHVIDQVIVPPTVDLASL